MGELRQPVFKHKLTGLAYKVEDLGGQPPRGGILADEMGLGKTIQCLAVIAESMSWSGELLVTCGNNGTRRQVGVCAVWGLGTRGAVSYVT